MKIFVLPTSYPDDQNPVANIFIYEQVKALAALGHEIVVLHVKKLSSTKFLSSADSSVKVYRDDAALRYKTEVKTFMENKFPKANRKNFISAMRRLYHQAELENGKPDVLYAHFSCWAGYAASQIAKERNIPCMCLEHYSGFMEPAVHKTFVKGLQQTVDSVERFCCVSPGLKASVLKLTGTDKEIDVISNMVDTCFRYVSPEPKEKLHFFAVGNLNHRKRFELLIDSFIEAFSPEDEVELRIGGNGEKYDALQKKILENHREHQIKLLGKLNRPQTLEQYIDCDCFVLPSAAETFGLVYREAMAVGRPIITTDHGGFDANTWDEKCGYMIPVDDKAALVSALKKMKDNVKLFDGKAISEFCLSTCDATVVGKEIEKHLLTVCLCRSGNEQ